MPLTSKQHKELVTLLSLSPTAGTYRARTALLDNLEGLTLDRDPDNDQRDLKGIVRQLVRLEANDALLTLIDGALEGIQGTGVGDRLIALRECLIGLPSAAIGHAEADTLTPIDDRILDYLLDTMVLQVTALVRSNLIAARTRLQEFVNFFADVTARMLGLTPLNFSAWPAEIKKFGLRMDASGCAGFAAVHGRGSLSNEGARADVSHQSVTRDMVTTRQFAETIAHGLGGTRQLVSLFNAIYRDQQFDERQRSARELADAIDRAGWRDDITIPATMSYARPILAAGWVRIERSDARKRVSRIANALARLGVTSEGDHLAGLARAVEHAFLSQGKSAGTILGWITQHGAHVTARPATRESVMRLSLDEDPSAAGAHLLREAYLLHPRVVRLDTGVKQENRRLREDRRIGDVVAEMINVAMRAEDSLRRPETIVLQFEVPPERALYPYEQAPRGRIGSIAHYVRCVTVKPIIEQRVGRTIEETIAHPAREDNSITLADPLAPSEIFARMRDKDCLFAGPLTWQCRGEPVSPVVDAFEYFSCAVLLPDAPDEKRIDGFFPNGREQRREVWELFDVVSERRRNERHMVIWDDPSYDVPRANGV